MADLVELLSTTSPVEARLLYAALTGEGMHPAVLDEGLSETIFAGRHVIPVRVMVPADELEDARVILAAFLADSDAPDDGASPEACPACGAPWEPGFSQCWRCGVALDTPESRGHGEVVGEEDDPEVAVDPAIRLDGGVDGLTLVVRRPPLSLKLMRYIVIPGIALYLFLGGTGLLITFLLGAVVLAVGSFRTLEIKADLHSLQVQDERMRWEDLSHASASVYLLAWQRTDGTEDSVRMLATEEQVEALSTVIEFQMARVRDPRDPEAEQALDNLRNLPRT